MSVYVDVLAELTLDDDALAALGATDLWEWLGDLASFSETSSLTDLGDGQWRLVLTDCFRNIGLALCPSLYAAWGAGVVRGTVIEDCTDGVNCRTVTTYTDDGVYMWSADCLAVTSGTAERVELRTIMGLPALLADGSGDAIDVDVDEGRSWCGCGGYGDDGAVCNGGDS